VWESSIPSTDGVVVGSVDLVTVRYVKSDDRVSRRSSIIRRPTLRLVLTLWAMYYDVSVEGSAKSNQLRLTAISATRGHPSEVFFKWIVDILLLSSPYPISSWSSCFEVVRCGVEFEVQAVFTHVVDHALADFWVFGRVGKELVRESSEETVA
jgi:hypothetical protein